MMQSTFALAFLFATALANQYYQMPRGAFEYGSGHGSFAATSGNDHKHGQVHKNPWQHTVVHHKTANDYNKDPWANRNTISNTDDRRDSWYSPYQQFSPPQVQYKPSVSHATFAQCNSYNKFSAGFVGTIPEVRFAQLKGKSVIVKRSFCTNQSIFDTDVLMQNYIMEFGDDMSQRDDASDDACQKMGQIFNPLAEVDKFGRPNPYQDKNRGTIPEFVITESTNQTYPTCFANNIGGFEDLEPISLLQNLEGSESIIGRTYFVTDTEITQATNNEPDSSRNMSRDLCCIISLAAQPEGFGPKPVPYPLTTHSSTYNSYGMNYAVPLPYHKHGYQSNADNNSYNHNFRAITTGLPRFPY